MSRLLSSTLAAAAALSIATSAGAVVPRSRVQGDLFDRAVITWAKVKTVRASFEQTIINALTGRTLTSTGEYQQERPGKLSVSFADPANDRIVTDGKYVWLYLPSSAPDQVIRSVQGAGGTGTVDLTAQFFTNPRARYAINPVGTLVVSGRATHGYTLTPKSEDDAPFKIASVWIDDADASVRQFEVTDQSGVQRKIRLTSLATNVPVDESVFRFTPPPGVRIVAR
ncbi:MAG TPA: outer membrane lipoprotein carrier protein LolA [Gemmatimonadaceae bacterium]